MQVRQARGWALGAVAEGTGMSVDPDLRQTYRYSHAPRLHRIPQSVIWRRIGHLLSVLAHRARRPELKAP